MSKFLALLIVGIFLLPCVLATDIAYVLKDVSKPETNIISAINELGYDYELIDDSDVSSTDFSDYEMILVGNENIKNIPVNEHKSLIVNKYYYNDWSKSIGSSGGSLPAKAFNLESDITEGIEGEFQVYTSCCSGGTTSLPVFYLAGKKYDSQAITTKGASGSDSSYFVIATKENPSRVFFGITETDYWTAESEQLFENSLSWILGNKLPVCEEVPDLEFNEDEQVILDLDNYCSDFEGDLSYSVHSTSNDKNITLDGFGDGLINITSAQDWNGEDWVIFRVSDGKDSILTNKITLTVLPVNDAPVISSYLPNTDSLSLIENIEQIFSVDVGDVDGDELVISWFLNGAEVGSGENYSFSENDGDYDLEVLVSDGEFSNNQVWELFVGDISEYTCSEVGGFIIQDYEICNGEILGVKNSDSCCSIEGVFGFSEIGRCDILNESLEINILDLDSGDEFNVGETISFKVEVKNNLDERLKFDIEVYLYDIINEDILEKADESLRLDKGKKSSISFSLKVPQDADVDSDNAVFVKLVDENKKCNEEYVKVSLVKKEHRVVINKVFLEQLKDSLSLDVEIENIGENDENVEFIIENKDLKISQTQTLQIDSGDKEEKEFLIKTPVDANGTYEIKIRVLYEGGEDYELKEIVFENGEVVENPEIELSDGDEGGSGGNVLIYILAGFFILVLLVIIYLFYFGIFKKV